MNKLTFLFAVGVVTASPLLADAAANAERLSNLLALSFYEVKRMSVAKLAPPAKTEDAAFHGCAMKSAWMDVLDEQRAAAIALRDLIADELAYYARAGDSDVILLQPLGFVYGDCGVRLETAEGVREFSIRWQGSSGYVYAYDRKKHHLVFSLDEAVAKTLKSLAGR